MQQSEMRLMHAKGQLISAINQISTEFKLTSSQMEGLLASVMIQVQDQTRLELLAEILSMKDGKEEGNGGH